MLAGEPAVFASIVVAGRGWHAERAEAARTRKTAR
jgi:hypothetical protein